MEIMDFPTTSLYKAQTERGFLQAKRTGIWCWSRDKTQVLEVK